ncbi:MAG: hypothetical protein QGG36_17955 [Pirellulaceae bacterium]|jgi:hypothetical protein|nr:hypothetical protein [Pirellulaceae bacterium]MDP7017694.1 hypothetical protein [Pirellulaceae bacterium]
MDGIDSRLLLSAASFLFTAYFWFVKARKERPNLAFYQLSDYRAVCRRHPKRDDMKRLCIQQLDTGGVLLVNHSTRQNSVVLFDCYLKTDKGEIQGDWGYSGEDKPPWNVGPESTIAFSPACFFDVAEDFVVPDEPEFRIEFMTASGGRFSHRFSKQAPRIASANPATSRAA